MPTTPNLDGLPPWLQLLVTLIFGMATLLVAVKGYRNQNGATPAVKEVAPGDTSAAIHSAVIADMGPMRRLNDVIPSLQNSLQSLERAIEEDTHYARNSADINREICHSLVRIERLLEAQARELSKREIARDRER